MTSGPFLQIRSPKFRILPGEDEELVNEGIYGKACALYLRDELARWGYATSSVVCEDWWWWGEISNFEFPCGIVVYGVRLGDTDDLDVCVSVHTPRVGKWNWSILRTSDTTAEIDRLYTIIRGIFESDAEIMVVGETPDFPL